MSSWLVRIGRKRYLPCRLPKGSLWKTVGKRHPSPHACKCTLVHAHEWAAQAATSWKDSFCKPNSLIQNGQRRKNSTGQDSQENLVMLTCFYPQRMLLNSKLSYFSSVSLISLSNYQIWKTRKWNHSAAAFTRFSTPTFKNKELTKAKPVSQVSVDNVLPN